MIHLSPSPHNSTTFPHYFTTMNDSDYDFSWWRLWLPLSDYDLSWWQLRLPLSSPYDNKHDNNSPSHHLRQPCFITNPISTPHDLRQLISITSPIPFPSLPRWHVPMSMQQENIFAREQVCVTVAWQHVSPECTLLADRTATHPCNSATTSKPP